MNVEKWQEIKTETERLQQRKSEAAGAYKMLLEQLASEFGCETEEAGEALLEQLEKEEALIETKLERALKRFEEQYGDKL